MRNSKRRKTKKDDSNQATGPESSQSTSNCQPIWERGENTKGLPILPDELLLEILSYFPPIPLLSTAHNSCDTAAYVYRRDTLLALSTSCSNLRRFFKPYVWERIEVCAGMVVGGLNLVHHSGKQTEKAFAVELIRQLEIVTIRDPSLAQYVKIVNVEVTDFSVHPVLVELGRCLSLFTNAHTVRLMMHVSSKLDLAATRAFKEHTYPHIRKVFLTQRAFPLLKSCPNLEEVNGGDEYPGTSLPEFISDFSRIKVVRHVLHPRMLELADRNYIFTVIEKLFPKVREVDVTLNPQMVASWYGLKRAAYESEETGKEIIHFPLLMKDLEKVETISIYAEKTADLRSNVNVIQLLTTVLTLLALQKTETMQKNLCIWEPKDKSLPYRLFIFLPPPKATTS